MDPVEKARREQEFGRGAVVPVLPHPPALRALGLKRKIKLRRTAGPVFRVLRAGRVLHGTPFDVFGYARVRRVERELVGGYRELVRAALQRLTPVTAVAVADIAALADVVRGYEDIKLARVAEFRARADEALNGLPRFPRRNLIPHGLAARPHMPCGRVCLLPCGCAFAPQRRSAAVGSR